MTITREYVISVADDVIVSIAGPDAKKRAESMVLNQRKED